MNLIVFMFVKDRNREPRRRNTQLRRSGQHATALPYWTWFIENPRRVRRSTPFLETSR